ncbi:hypothetical protein ThvES_00007130, partial [Thiovulum sp. ES]
MIIKYLIFPFAFVFFFSCSEKNKITQIAQTDNFSIIGIYDVDVENKDIINNILYSTLFSTEIALIMYNPLWLIPSAISLYYLKNNFLELHSLSLEDLENMENKFNKEKLLFINSSLIKLDKRYKDTRKLKYKKLSFKKIILENNLDYGIVALIDTNSTS